MSGLHVLVPYLRFVGEDLTSVLLRFAAPYPDFASIWQWASYPAVRMIWAPHLGLHVAKVSFYYSPGFLVIY